MIGYVTLGTNNLGRSAKFYDVIAQEMGIGRFMEDVDRVGWGTPGSGALLVLMRPFDGKPATVGNGVMAALAVKDNAQVDRLHALALELGGTDEGAPGYRRGFYIAYFRDLDGNKLNFIVLNPGT